MPTSAAARGSRTEARTPVRAKSMAPAMRKARHPCSQRMPAGTWAEGQTMESSSPVRTTEASGGAERSSQAGSGAVASRRAMESSPGRSRRVRFIGYFCLGGGGVCAGCCGALGTSWPSKMIFEVEPKRL